MPKSSVAGNILSKRRVRKFFIPSSGPITTRKLTKKQKDEMIHQAINWSPAGAIFARRLAIKAAARGRPGPRPGSFGESRYQRKKFPKKWEAKAEVKERRKRRAYEFFDDADPETPLFTAQGHLTKGGTQLHVEGMMPSQELLQKGLVRRRKKGVSQRLRGPDPALHLLSAQNKLVKGIIGARGIREALKSAKRLDPSVTSLTGYRVTGIHSQAARDMTRTISIVKKRKKDVLGEGIVERITEQIMKAPRTKRFKRLTK